MINQNWHQVQYMHNKKLSDDMMHSFQSQYNDWQITSLFYSALHLINSYFYKNNMPRPTNHRKRSEAVKKELPAIYSEYQELRELSEHARYKLPYSSMTDADVLRAQTNFQKIVAHIDEA